MSIEHNSLMTVQEACDALMVGKNTIYDLIRSNKIDAFRTGRTWKINRNSLVNFIKQESHLA